MVCRIRFVTVCCCSLIVCLYQIVSSVHCHLAHHERYWCFVVLPSLVHIPTIIIIYYYYYYTQLNITSVLYEVSAKQTIEKHWLVVQRRPSEWTTVLLHFNTFTTYVLLARYYKIQSSHPIVFVHAFLCEFRKSLKIYDILIK